jgi:hypothetical protein
MFNVSGTTPSLAKAVDEQSQDLATVPVAEAILPCAHAAISARRLLICRHAVRSAQTRAAATTATAKNSSVRRNRVFKGMVSEQIRPMTEWFEPPATRRNDLIGLEQPKSHAFFETH